MEKMTLVEVGPRFCLNPIKIFSGSFGGPTLYENPYYVSPNTSVDAHSSAMIRIYELIHIYTPDSLDGENTRFAGTLTLGNGKTITGWTTFPAAAIVRNLQLVYNETSSPCNLPELLTEAPANSILICNLNNSNADLGTVMLFQQDSDVRATIVITEDPQIFRSTSIPLPAVVISPAEVDQPC